MMGGFGEDSDKYKCNIKSSFCKEHLNSTTYDETVKTMCDLKYLSKEDKEWCELNKS